MLTRREKEAKIKQEQIFPCIQYLRILRMKLLLLEKSEETYKWKPLMINFLIKCTHLSDWLLFNCLTFSACWVDPPEVPGVGLCLSLSILSTHWFSSTEPLYVPKTPSIIMWPNPSPEQVVGIKLHCKWIYMIKLLTCWLHLSREKYINLCSVDACPPDTSFWSVSVKDRVCFMSE